VVKFLRRRPLPVIAIAVVAAATLAGGYYETRKPNAVERISDGYKEALDKVRQHYPGGLDLETLGKHTLNGMLHQLDPHSNFLTKTEFDEVQSEQRSRTYGIGVTIARRHDRVYIMSVTPGGPGDRAGLRYGDAIIAVDGVNTEEWSTEQVMHKVRGERGAPVGLTVSRAGAADPIDVRIRRDEVKLPSVRNAFMVDQGSGYIALTGGFSTTTEQELVEALERLKREGMRQLILDLRGNPGGLLDQAIYVSRKFLAPGQKIVEVRGREGRSTVNAYHVPEENVPETIPIVVLINRGSASASEIVAGALQDHDRAIIVGENSFGKGLVQGLFHLWGGTGLVLTTARYYTPTGRLIQRDYSNISFYDYYSSRNGGEQGETGAPRGDALYTDLGRTVYGGGGIHPDVPVKSSPINVALYNGVFDFVRQLVAGQIPRFREYEITETHHKSRLSPEEINRYAVTDSLVNAFREYTSSKPAFNVSDERFQSELDFIRAHMRREILSAAYGPEAGEQSYLSYDPQFRRAVESLDQARALADKAQQARVR
jgi:carboxyl-terminal processing protease